MRVYYKGNPNFIFEYCTLKIDTKVDKDDPIVLTDENRQTIK